MPKPKKTEKRESYRLAYMPQIERIAIRCGTYLHTSLRCFDKFNEHNSDSGKWFTVPATRSNVLALEALATPDSVGDEYKEFRNDVMRMDTTWAQGAEEWSNLQRALLPHQRQFMELAHNKVGMFNASEQGTGKTAPALVLAKSLGARRVVVLCPKSLVDEWANEQQKLFGDKAPYEIVDLCNDTISRRKALAEEVLLQRLISPKQGVMVFVNYEALTELAEYLICWKPNILFVDESWRVKNPTAITTVAAMCLSEHCSQRFPLGGTVIGNHVGDLWSQIRIINPELLGGMTYEEFLARFATFQAVNTPQGARQMPIGISDPIGLIRLIEPVWFRAIKSTCLNLPPKQHYKVKIKLHKDTQKLYNDVKQNGLSALGVDLSLEGNRVVKLRLHQIAGGFKPIPTGEVNKDGNMIWKVEPIPCSKTEWLIQWAKDHIDNTSEIRNIVWVRFNAEGERICNALEKVTGKGSAVFIYNETKREDLEKWKEDFNSRNPNGIKWLVCQTQKMCNGHNLPAADNHFFFSNSHSYIYRSQAEERSDRADRINQCAVSIYDLISVGTIDEEIIDTIERKENMAIRLTPSTSSDTIGEISDVEEEQDITFDKDFAPF